MSGVVLMICIPTEDHEKSLVQKMKKKVTIEPKTETFHYNTNESTASQLGNLEKNNLKNAPKYVYEKKDRHSMQHILQDVLKEQEITNATWCKGADDNFLQIIFSLESTDRCEEILDILKENKIGKRFDSVVSVIPCTVHYHNSFKEESKFLDESYSESLNNKNTAWNQFVSSVKSRLTVAQVVENVKLRAALTFDFICLLFISTALCAIGLVENSNVCLLSSVLISPMMGPVMAGTFGSVIKDKRLQKTGVRNELIGLGIATLVGFCYGSVICTITDKYGSQEWPTYPMVSSGELKSIWVGCLIALLSGAAVSLGILSDNIASLVGVAISTSLMPPAVNAGLLWSLAAVYHFKGNETTRFSTLTQTHHYSNHEGIELTALGAVSICLTFVNIICIYFAGILVFKIKEVAPMASRDPARRHFWAHEIKLARANNSNQRGEDRQYIYKTIYGDNFPNNDCLCHSTDLTRDHLKVLCCRPEYTWSPCMDMRKNPLLGDTCARKCANSSINLAHTNRPSRQRRLSQIFNDSEEEKLPSIKETCNEKTRLLPKIVVEDKIGKSFLTKTKEFIVTPCENDPLYI